jgi:hypothetical protein
MHDLVYRVTALSATGFRNDLVDVCVGGGVVEACQPASMTA